MSSEIVWYGERGIVNALVTDLTSRGTVVNGVRDLLHAVHWAGDQDTGWIDALASVSILVEVGMGQFGNPDAILVCRVAGSAHPHVVFLEAKVIPYLESAMANAGTMAARGYNSSINGQLVLKYRLSHALREWQGQESLAEPAGLHRAYRRPPGQRGGLGEPAHLPRHLGKPAVLELIRQKHLHGLPLSHYHFVAWTWDAAPFFGPTTCVSDDLMPLFLGPDGECAWAETSGRVGWIGFQQVKDCVQPGPACNGSA